MAKETARASSDVALIKYWGKKDPILRLPENGSVSIILSGLDTVTTVDFEKGLHTDEVVIEGESDPHETARVRKHLDLIRQLADVELFARVQSVNTFPKGTGLSSSGSGFAALTVAAAHALELKLSPKEMSILARQGSGTACRCVQGGFVEWKDGDTSETSYSETLYPSTYWDIRDIVAVVDRGKKKVSSTEGHESAHTSLLYEPRLQHIKQKITEIKESMHDRDFSHFGEILEAEALEFHSILLTSIPPFIAWYPGTIQVMHEVQQMRSEGIEAYFTINTGFNVHVLTLPMYESAVQSRLQNLSLVESIILAKVGDAPELIQEHLF